MYGKRYGNGIVDVAALSDEIAFGVNEVGLRGSLLTYPREILRQHLDA